MDRIPVGSKGGNMIVPRDVGVSNISYLSETLHAIINNTPHNQPLVKVLDVGCGKGVYGMILKSIFGNKLEMDGIDVGIGKLTSSIYDNVTKIDVSSFVKTNTKKYDLIFMNHVLEHLVMEDAIDIIKMFQSQGHGAILIGLPNSIKGFEYSDFASPHTHKWGIHNFPFEELGLVKIEKAKANKLFIWKAI